MYLCEFKDTLDYTRPMLKQIKMVVAYIFNLGTRESYIFSSRTTGNIKLRGERGLVYLVCLVYSHLALVEVRLP